MRALRIFGVFVLFVLVYWAVGSAVAAVIYLINQLDVRPAVAYVFASVFGGGLGVAAGVYILNGYFRPYPAKGFRAAFIGLYVFLVILGLIGGFVSHVETVDYQYFGGMVRAVVACVVAWYGLRPDPAISRMFPLIPGR